MGTMASNPRDDAVVHGLDAHWLSKSGKWSLDSQLMTSDKNSETGYGLFADLSWNPKRGVGHRFSLDWLDDELDISDLGFLRRNDIRGVGYRYFRSTSRGLPAWLRNRRVMIFSQIQQNTDGRLNQSYLGMRGEWLTQKKSGIHGEVEF
jgi:hypothetical protein